LARRRNGRKELVGFTDGALESAQDWRDLLLDLNRRGIDVPLRLAIVDGALGFWKAAGEVWPKTRQQRCWVPRRLSHRSLSHPVFHYFTKVTRRYHVAAGLLPQSGAGYPSPATHGPKG
jgi:Transposase, Mutator family